ncbi:erythronate-4-phosphate dehydrogenase [Klebsiella pneumoniae]|uniref:Erythronate-4-phosphate dehydrogenase n=1 Tax=Klebsiella pneumoniae TaxID=573 RepID=A0A2X3E9H3_KLEPN|nr:erythronate-4-phosphate dehydrogenase [Klebsiella pneumoniae]
MDIGTAHIAGYTLEGKARGTTQVFEAYSAFIGHPQQVALDTLLPAPEFGRHYPAWTARSADAEKTGPLGV